MNDGANADALEFGRAEAASGAGSAYRMEGYCAGCGTWDSHGRSCLSCGYEFTPDVAAVDEPVD